jgi:hypothetical protein
MARRRGRREPYTERGIKRIPCARCGEPSSQQWQCCANDNRYLGVCDSCDVDLNRRVLRFFRFKNADELMKKYKTKKQETNDE